MSNISLVVLTVVCGNVSNTFLATLSEGGLAPLKSWGKASYPIPSSIVMGQGDDVASILASCGLASYTVKTGEKYANGFFSNEKEVGAFLATLGHTVKASPAPASKSAPVSKPVSKPAPAPVIEDVSVDSIPSILADSFAKWENGEMDFKTFRSVATSEGLPSNCNAPNSVRKWTKDVLKSQAVPATPAPATPDSDLMEKFKQFQQFLAMQGK